MKRSARGAAPAFLLALALTLGGCPDGAELENPDRFRQYPPGTAGASASGGQAGGVSFTWNCPEDLTMALKQNCARSGCHNTASHYAGLDLTDPSTIRARMVDQIATHGDIGCNVLPEPFRMCTPAELTALGCPPDVKLIDSTNFAGSWVVTKFADLQGDCGTHMPFQPGDSAMNGWSEARKQCYLDFFRSLATPQ